MPLDGREITWDNKRGWSIPRWVIDSSPLLISVYCVATLGGKEFQSAVYLIHVTGEAARNSSSELNSSFKHSIRWSQRGGVLDRAERDEIYHGQHATQLQDGTVNLMARLRTRGQQL